MFRVCATLLTGFVTLATSACAKPGSDTGANGEANATIPEARTSIIDADEDGSSIVIHENADDHITQPIGSAGGRIACGIIRRE